jgi:hypothetical protein
MTTLTRKERQVIIDKWLNDEEDENYVVAPMKTKKGKFIVRPRKERTSSRSSNLSVHEDDNKDEHEDEREDEHEDDNKDEHEDDSEDEHEDDNKHVTHESMIRNSEAPHKKSTSNSVRKDFVRTVEARSPCYSSASGAVYSRNKDMEIRRTQFAKSARIEDSLPEILEHLKMLGEDIKRRQQKKDIKHEIKYIQSKAANQRPPDEYAKHGSTPNLVREVNVTQQSESIPRYVRRKINLAAILHL